MSDRPSTLPSVAKDAIEAWNPGTVQINVLGEWYSLTGLHWLSNDLLEAEIVDASAEEEERNQYLAFRAEDLRAVRQPRG